jgi:NAD(P)-dependent dehydrogenase (short-subunit alcohol dehydrogenase family)
MSDVLAFYSGRPVVVTGCSSGIGGAVAQKLSGAGASVIGVDRNTPDTELAQFIQTDLGDPESIASSASRLPAEVWGLFCCAGLSGGAADPQTVLRVNFIGTRDLLERVEPRIPRGGAIVSTSSGAGQDFEKNKNEVISLVRTSGFDEAAQWAQKHDAYVKERGGYQVSKEALVLYTLERCFELGERGLRINCIAPGVTDTPMLKDSAKVYGEEFFKIPPKPLGRKASAEEQANILIYLNSDWASYVNGQTIWSDGGNILRRALPN